jgi:hypothetical protein
MAPVTNSSVNPRPSAIEKGPLDAERAFSVMRFLGVDQGFA